MKKVLTQCEFKDDDGKCTCPPRKNVVDEFDEHPPVLTPVMALVNHKNDKFHILTVPEFLTWRKNLPPYVVFDKNPTDEFLKLAGSWEDERSAEEIIADIKTSRRNSSRFGENNELFN